MALVEVPHFTHAAAIAKPNSGAFSRVCTLANLAVAYWVIFWLMNGVEEFLIRQDLGTFARYDQSRTEQLVAFVMRADLPVAWLDLLLVGMGAIQLVIALPLLLVLTHSLKGRWMKRKFFEMSFFLGGVMFVGFSGLDIILGESAGLWGSGVFLIVFLLTYKLAKDSFEERGLLETNS